MAAQKAQKHYYSIGEAALSLNVAIDTIRRWEKTGKIKAIRSAGGMRLFPVEEIERLLPLTQQSSTYLTVSQAANFLGVSSATLRRWDRQGKLKPIRTVSNERLYDEEALKTFSAEQGARMRTNAEGIVQQPSAVAILKEKAFELSDTVLLTFIDGMTIRKHAPKVALATAFLIVVALVFLIQQPQTSTTKMVLGASTIPAKDLAAAFAKAADQQGYNVVLYPKDDENGQTKLLTTAAGQQVLLSDPSFELPTSSPYAADLMPGGQVLPTLQNTESTTISSELIQTSTQRSGSASIAAGQTYVAVNNPGLMSHQKVHITPTSPIDTAYWVSEKNAGVGFTVGIAKPTTQPITFDWLITE